MKEETMIPPTLLNLITTNKCTAACKDCCFSCNPQKQDKLTLSEMKQYVDQAIQTYNTTQVLVLTDGECFTLGSNLDKIVKYASTKGLCVRDVYTLKAGMENTYIAVDGFAEKEFDEYIDIVREVSPTYFDTHSENEVKNLMKINIINNL